MFKEEIKNIKTGTRELRNFGIVVGAVFAALWALSFLFGGRTSVAFLVIGIFLVFWGALAPRALYWPYRIWMGFAVVMGWIMSRLILTILFFVVVTIVGLIARAVGKDFLNLKKNKNARSYWHRREDISRGKERMEKQF